MSNLVTVNSGSAVNGSLKAGRVSISTDSSITPTSGGKTWYNMINPAEGYVFVTDNKIQAYGDGVPLIYPTQTTLPADILATINGLPDRRGSVPFDNVWDALVWVQSTGKYFILDKTLSGNVSDEIKIYLNASNISSYPQSGSIIYDLSGEVNNGSLINGPTFNYEGWINFDGADDYINHGVLTNVNSTSVTTEVLVRFTGTLDSNDRKIFCYRKSLGSPYAAFQARKGNGTTGLYYQFNNGGTWYTATLNNIMPSGDTWYHYTFVHDGYQVRTYRNGELFQTNNFAALIDYSSVQNFLLGYRTAAEYWKGDISNLKLYNKALSQSEVSQNYYGAPIVTDSLQFALNPSNIVSYPKSGTDIYSLTGSLSGSLINGVTFDTHYGGILETDGVDDAIVTQPIPYTGNASNSVTWELWVNPLDDNGNIMSMSSANPQTAWNMPPIVADGGRFRGKIWSNNFLYSGYFNKGEWYHVVLVFDYSNSAQYFYVNGELVASQTGISYSASSTNNYLFLGQANPGADNTGDFAGKYGAFRVYSKALSPTEILQNYNAEYSRFKSSRDITKEGLGLQISPSNPNSYLSGTTISDLSGNSRDGTLINNPTFLVENGGIIEFDGTDDYIDFGSLAGTFISDPASNGGVISFSIWVYAIGGYYIMSSGAQTSSRGIAISYQNGSPFISIRTGAKQRSYSPGGNFPTGEWIHWVAVSDNINWVVYKNGVQISSQTLSNDSVSDAQTKLTIGVPNNAVTNYHFEGKVGDVAFWDTALTAQDVSNLYTSQAPRYRVQLPRSTTDSLKLNLDAGDTTSYSRTGTTWYDRSGNGNNATLYNSPTYTIAEGGVFDLDGTDDYFISPASAAGMYNFGTDGTLEMWFRPDASFTTNHRLLCVTNNASAIDVYINPSGQLRLHGGQAYATQTVPINEWTHLMVTYVGGVVQIYFNGEAQTMAGTKLTGYNITNNNDLWIGQFSGGGSYYFNGKIANAKIYHRGLTPSEVLENYKSTRSRFGGTTLNLGTSYWDPSNVNSFNNSSNDLLDLSGAGFIGKLTNGPTFTPEVGGNITLDGIDDAIIIPKDPVWFLNEWTWEFWIKFPTTNITYQGIVWAEGAVETSTGDSGFQYLFSLLGDNTFHYRISNTSTGWGYTNVSININPLKWNHVVWQFNNGTTKIYTNGQPLDTNTSRGSYNGGDNSRIFLGARNDISFGAANIQYGYVAYHTTALSDTDVLNNYNAQRNRFGLD